MLQLTADRVLDQVRFAAPMVVANARHASEIEAQFADAAGVRLILEPVARNTAAAIALAALSLPSQAAMLVMPSDHAIADVDAFCRAVDAAAPALADGWLVALGIDPHYPETGYGYIKRGASIFPGVHRAEEFVEKPDGATAEAYLATGAYSWNGGIFLFRAGDFLAELKRHAPDVLEAASGAVNAGATEGARFYPDRAAFAASPSISIDYAVMEKAGRVAVVPVEMGWSDIGSWDSLHSFLQPDDRGNVADEGSVLLDSQGCLIRSSGPTVTAVGIRDLIVIATADSVMIVPRGESQRIKEIVEALKRGGSPLLD